MRFDGIKAHNIGPLRDVELDFTRIAGTLVAVTGDNGAGKSTLLELLPAALYRATPTRGTLADLATSRDAYVEVRAVNGHAYTIRQTADAVSGKGEALILDEAGEPQTTGAKVSAADIWVRDHFPPSSVLYASQFLPQASRGFLDYETADRKSMLLRLLQIERFERYAKSAREHAIAAKQAVAAARTRLEDTRQRYPTMFAALANHDEAKATLAAAELDVANWQKELEELRARLAARSQLAHLRAQHLAVSLRITKGEADLHDIEERITNNRWLMGRADEIKAAIATVERVDAALPRYHTELAEARTKETAAKDAYGVHERAAYAAYERVKSTNERVLRATDRTGDAARVRAAVEALPGSRASVEELGKRVEELRERITKAETALRNQKDTRITGLRTGLGKIASPPTDRGVHPAPTLIAQETLASDDKKAAKFETGPAAIDALRAELSQYTSTQLKTKLQLEQWEQLAARADDLQHAETELAQAQADATQAAADRAAADAAVRTASEQLEAAWAACKILVPAIAKLVADRNDAQKDAGYAQLLATAEAKIEAYEPQAARLRAQLELDRAELASLPAVPADEDIEDRLEALETTLAEAIDLEREARSEVAMRAERIEQARAGEAACAQCAAELEAKTRELENWTRIGQDCGRDGIQALEIDAALPELNTLTNDLLHACYGPRFTLEVRTSRPDSTGTRELEDLEVFVVDTQKGFDGEAWRYSGGEKVILSEALSLALTMLACQRAGLSRPTLVRDESGAALAPGNARAYVAMLRRAAELIGADKVFFVSHNPELQRLADARIEVRGGTAVLT